ncbi:MAG TPA: cyclic nucleotide-binding domain-containing protein [Trebonia sp.]|nr:cyclic nucleotide-binding domain-containing protein [Trebonia sp.]
MNNSTDSPHHRPPRTPSAAFWDSLSEVEREAFAARARERTFARGATLMHEGEPGDSVAVIRSGWTQIINGPGGQPIVVAERGPGQLIGEMAVLRLSARSATVVALDMVQALVMGVRDFADFLGAHPDVRGMVESQAEERLAGEPQVIPGMTVAPYPTAVPRPTDTYVDPLMTLPTAGTRLFHGENCTVFRTDVVGFGKRTRNDDDRMIIRKSLLDMTRTALGELRERCYYEDRGDGILVVAPADIPTVVVLHCFLGGLPYALRRHNRIYGSSAHIQLRLASDVGPVTSDDLGVQGEAIIRTARMLEAGVLKAAIARDHANLGIVVSEFVYNTAIAQPGGLIDPDGYHQIRVRVKETRQLAWMKIIGSGTPLTVTSLIS